MSNLVECVYENILGKKGVGKVLIDDVKIKFVSGPWGRGLAPRGLYNASKLTGNDSIKTLPNAESFSQHGFGWFLLMEPTFDTDRFGIGIHCDGGIEGTMGCIGINTESYQQNKNIYDRLKDLIHKHGKIIVKVR